jgi:hypothetical protein
MTLKEFYAKPDLADGFGSTKGGRPNPHRGLDFAHPAGTPIPAHTGGTVVMNEWSAVLGNVVEIVGPNGRYYGYRHMLRPSPLPVGSPVARGGIVGLVGNTGSASRGNHLCTTNGGQRGSVNGINVIDPWPQIFASVNAAPEPGPTPTPPYKRRKDMFLDWAGGTGYLTTTNGVLALGSMQVYNLFFRKINSDQRFHPDPSQVPQVPGTPAGKPMEFNGAEQQIVNAHLKMLTVQQQTSIAIDPAKLTAALKDALKDYDPNVEIPAEVLAKAFDEATPRVVNALLKEQAKRLGAMA